MLQSALHSSITQWNTRETIKTWLSWDYRVVITENPFQLRVAQTPCSAKVSQLSTGQSLLSQRWSTPLRRTRMLTHRRKIDVFKRQPRWSKIKELKTKTSVQSLCSQLQLMRISRQHPLTTKSLDSWPPEKEFHLLLMSHLLVWAEAEKCGPTNIGTSTKMTEAALTWWPLEAILALVVFTAPSTTELTPCVAHSSKISIWLTC